AEALERSQERGLFSAHVRAGAFDDVDVEREGGAEDVLAEESGLARRLDGGAERGRRARVFASDVDEAARGADRVAAQRDALDDREWIALHEVLVDVRAGVAFVGVADDVSLGAVLRVRGGEAPLGGGGE